MGKIFLDDNATKDLRRKRKSNGKPDKYLKPGALAQHRSCKALTAKPYTDLRKKSVAVLDDWSVNCVLQSKSIVSTPSATSPVNAHSPITKLTDAKQISSNIHLKTPEIPFISSPSSESMLESLPMDILVKIICHLHHDQLKPAFHVSQRLRTAVLLAMQIHFNYKTPKRSRQELMRAHAAVPAEQWSFLGNGDVTFVRVSSPHTPKAPRHGPRPPSRLKYTDMRQIKAVLFQETPFPKRYTVPLALPRPPCKPVVSHRILFYEEKLCQAVTRNKLS
ncbi:unnamed protein product [Rhodiola kirilowii]